MSTLAMRRRLLMACDFELELSMSSTYWTLNSTSYTTFATNSDSIPIVQYKVSGTNNLLGSYIHTKNKVNFSKYKKCLVSFTLNSLSSLVTHPLNTYLGLAIGSSSDGASLDNGGSPLTRASYDWAARGYMIGMYRTSNSGSTIPALTAGEYVAEFDISDITDNDYLTLYLTSYKYSANYQITSVVLT